MDAALVRLPKDSELGKYMNLTTDAWLTSGGAWSTNKNQAKIFIDQVELKSALAGHVGAKEVLTYI